MMDASGERKNIIHVKAKSGWLELDLKELFRYKDLIWLLFKRNYTTRYKQTILGPLWLIVNPMLTVLLYAVIFGKLAGLSTGGIPQIIFYLCSNSIWCFFSTCVRETSNTFTANAAIMGKVYFPRLVMPLSAVLTGAIDFLVQLGMLVVVCVIYYLCGYQMNINESIVLLPILVLQTGVLGLGIGIIVASATTKYRDLAVLVGFGLQLWMYGSPVVYTLTLIPEKYRELYLLNPMSAIIECWRGATLGLDTFVWKSWGISGIITVLVLLGGVVIFNRVEKTFMDTV